MDELPLAGQFESIRKAWLKGRHLAIKSPTGSGKSVGLPMLLLQEKMVEGQILVVQPRRAAARFLARRVASLLPCEVGEVVGYQVRFEKRYSDETRILYLTDGIFLNKMLSDPTLSRVGLVIFDEFHERSLQVDLSFALCKKLCADIRPSLRLIVTSATLELSGIENYLDDCKSLELTSRSFPVQIEHRLPKQSEPIWREIAFQLKKLLSEQDGNVLIFMDGAFEISRVIREIQKSSWSSGLEVRALFGEMSSRDQDQALAPANRRKVIVSTNIAETSLTIEGVTIVIDSGKAKKASYDPSRKVNVLLSQPISKSAAEQRAGRAGRTSPGYCLRMWTLAEHERRDQFEKPEIQRMDLSEIYLKLRVLSIDPAALEWFEPPPGPSLSSARSLLVGLGALSDEKELITELGAEIAKFPFHPRLGKSLVEAKRRNCLASVALTFAMAETRGPLTGRIGDYGQEFDDWFSQKDLEAESDLLVFLRAYQYAQENRFSTDICRNAGIHAMRCREAEQLATIICRQSGSSDFKFETPPYREYLMTLMSAYPENVCSLKSRGVGLYETLDGRRVHLPKSSAVSFSEWVLCLRIVEKVVKGSVALEMEFVSSVPEEILLEFFAGEITSHEVVYLEMASRQVVRRKYLKLGVQEFSSKESYDVSSEDVSSAYAKALSSGDLVLKKWDAKVEAFLARVGFLHSHHPEYEIQPLDPGSKDLLFEQICTDKTSWKSIRNEEVLPFVKGAFSETQLAMIDKLVPDEIDLGNGRKPYRVTYAEKDARVSVRLQDLYSLQDHPTILGGQCRLIVDILAPNGRSVQLTADLPAFWTGSYPEIKKELAGRYPKHEWR